MCVLVFAQDLGECFYGGALDQIAIELRVCRLRSFAGLVGLRGLHLQLVVLHVFGVALTGGGI